MATLLKSINTILQSIQFAVFLDMRWQLVMEMKVVVLLYDLVRTCQMTRSWNFLKIHLIAFWIDAIYSLEEIRKSLFFGLNFSRNRISKNFGKKIGIFLPLRFQMAHQFETYYSMDLFIVSWPQWDWPVAQLMRVYDMI